MQKCGSQFSDTEFKTTYYHLKHFYVYYDNEETAGRVAMQGIVEAFMEKKAKHDKTPITEETATSILSSWAPFENARDAGRKPKFPEWQQYKMLEDLEAGKSMKQVAEEHRCSISYLEKLKYKARCSLF